MMLCFRQLHLCKHSSVMVMDKPHESQVMSSLNYHGWCVTTPHPTYSIYSAMCAVYADE